MSEPAGGVVLVDEAVDVTTNEVHFRLIALLHMALGCALRGKAAVLADIFLRVDNREQVAPDVLIAMGSSAGTRTVYAVPAEPVPSVTMEVLSPVNRDGEGRTLLLAKRSLLGRIGVPLHIEIDPDDGVITVWESREGVLARVDVCTSYCSEAIGGVRIETPQPGTARVFLPSGHEVLDGGEELARAEQLAARLRTMGVDPDSP